MRWMLIALLVGCGGTYVCHSPCVGGTETTIYLCDGGQCPVGQSNATAYLQCVCGDGRLLIAVEPDQPVSCREFKDQWSAFYSANCR